MVLTTTLFAQTSAEKSVRSSAKTVTTVDSVVVVAALKADVAVSVETAVIAVATVAIEMLQTLLLIKKLLLLILLAKRMANSHESYFARILHEPWRSW